MEIKSIKKREIEYPKLNEISGEKIKLFIPERWIKLGIKSFLFNALMNSKSFAAVITPSIAPEAGVQVYYNPIYNNVKGGCDIISLISVVTFIISAIVITYKKIKAKKQDKKNKISKKIKIILIISIILFALSRIGILIVNYLKDIGILGGR